MIKANSENYNIEGHGDFTECKRIFLLLFTLIRKKSDRTYINSRGGHSAKS